MRKFNLLVVNEWVKMAKKRSFVVPYLILLIFPQVLGYIIHSVSPDSIASAAGFTREMLLPTGMGQVMTILSIIGTAGIVAKEHSRGTIKFLLIRARSRTAILASKYVTVLLYVLSLTAVAAAAIFLSGMIWFNTGGGETGVADILLALLYGCIYSFVYVTLAFMLGVLTHSTGVAIGLPMFLLTMDKIVIYRSFYKYFLFPNLDLSVYGSGQQPRCPA